MANTYQPVPGYFLQDNAQATAVAVPPRFGLIVSSPGHWATLFEKIHAMNKGEASKNTAYKLFLLTRHGQGYHNVAADKYSYDIKLWEEYWTKQEGDGELIWGPDPVLTPLGVNQAQAIRDVWMTEAKAGLPPPHRRYCSPLTRALDTCDAMLQGVFEAHPHPVVVLELCREIHGVHTCDKRRPRSYISAHKPHFVIEEDFTEDDTLWHPEIREPRAAVVERAKTVLDRIFRECSKEDIFISITAHKCWINSFLTAIGRELGPLPTGGVVPVIIKATAQEDSGFASHA